MNDNIIFIKCEKCKKDINKVDFLTNKCNFCGYLTNEAIEYIEFMENTNGKTNK